jgi:hypothetical protein
LSLPAVDRITRNVLDRLAAQSVGILGISDACGSNPAVEAATIDFSANMSALPQTIELAYHWTASKGDWAENGQPVFQLTLPSPPDAVTVTITGPDGFAAFGTLTFMPMTIAEYEQVQIECGLEQMVEVATRSRLSIESGRDRGALFARPLWNPIRGSGLTPYSKAQLKRLAATAKAVAALADRLLERPVHPKQSGKRAT